MKLVVTLLTSFSVSAFAQVPRVELNSASVSVPSDTVEISRTPSTPEKVELFLRIPMVESYCSEYGTRWVYGRHQSCGYHNEYDLYCDGRIVQPPYPGGRPQPIPGAKECHWVTRQVMNSCYYEESYCVRTSQRTVMDQRKIRLKFKKASNLSGTQREIWRLFVEQERIDDSSIRIDVDTIQAYKSYKIAHDSSAFRSDSLEFKGR